MPAARGLFCRVRVTFHPELILFNSPFFLSRARMFGQDLLASDSRDKFSPQKSPQGLRRAGFQDFIG